MAGSEASCAVSAVPFLWAAAIFPAIKSSQSRCLCYGDLSFPLWMVQIPKLFLVV